MSELSYRRRPTHRTAGEGNIGVMGDIVDSGGAAAAAATEYGASEGRSI